MYYHAKHLPKEPIARDSMMGLDQFTAVCGTSTWDISFTTEGVECLRCKGTQGFWDLKDKESARARLARLGDDLT